MSHHCVRILAHSFSLMVLQLIEFCTALLKPRNRISNRLRYGLCLDHCNTFILFFFSHSVGDLLCLRSLSCCMIQLNCWTDDLTLEYFGRQTSSWSPQWLQGARVKCRQNKPKSTPFHHCVDGWYEVFVLRCYDWFSPNMMQCIMGKHLHFGLVCPKDIVPGVLLFDQMQLSKPKLCCHNLFREKSLSSF